jgi:hypothetical protein
MLGVELPWRAVQAESVTRQAVVAVVVQARLQSLV